MAVCLWLVGLGLGFGLIDGKGTGGLGEAGRAARGEAGRATSAAAGIVSDRTGPLDPLFAAVRWGVRSATAADDAAPFAIRRHAVRGLIVQVWPLEASDCAEPASDLLVLSTEGGPPTQQKWLTWMPCGSALRPGDSRILERRLSDAAVVIDVARLPARSGPQLLSVSAAGLRIEALSGAPSPRDFAIPGGLPLPPRPWEIGRLPLVDDWNANGRPAALVPSLTGGWLIELDTDAAPDPGAQKRGVRALPLPVYASYRTWTPFLPATVWKWMIQEVRWPTLARADDNGDGRLDLFALSRWEIWIYHAGVDGLPSQPSRKLSLVPFDEEQERRHEASGNNYFARDLDGDGRADLMLNTIGGGMLKGRSQTRIHLGGAGGVSIDGPANALRDLEGGFSGFDFADVDGDGLAEIVETSFEFGLVQIMRLLVTRRAETTVRVLRLEASAEGGTRTLFEDQFSFGLDFGDGRFSGLVPSMGDWNGDGVLDLYVARGSNEIAFRLGSKRAGEPLFGKRTGRQPVPLESGESRIVDLDGDGLDEIVSFDDTDPMAPLIVFENRGRLPGTPPTLAPAPGRPSASGDDRG